MDALIFELCWTFSVGLVNSFPANTSKHAQIIGHQSVKLKINDRDIILNRIFNLIILNLETQLTIKLSEKCHLGTFTFCINFIFCYILYLIMVPRWPWWHRSVFFAYFYSQLYINETTIFPRKLTKFIKKSEKAHLVCFAVFSWLLKASERRFEWFISQRLVRVQHCTVMTRLENLKANVNEICG